MAMHTVPVGFVGDSISVHSNGRTPGGRLRFAYVIEGCTDQRPDAFQHDGDDLESPDFGLSETDALVKATAALLSFLTAGSASGFPRMVRRWAEDNEMDLTALAMDYAVVTGEDTDHSLSPDDVEALRTDVRARTIR